MEEDRWVETRKTFEYAENGKLIPREVVTELKLANKANWFTRNKDFFDFLSKMVTAAAISIPIIIFVNQQRAEALKQKALLQTKTYSELSTKLHRWERLKTTIEPVEIIDAYHVLGHAKVTLPSLDATLAYDSTFISIMDEYYPTVSLLKDQPVLQILNQLRLRVLLSDLSVTALYNLPKYGEDINRLMPFAKETQP